MTDTVLDMFRRTVVEAPGSPLLAYFDGVLTAADVDRSSDALAMALADGGFGRGDRLALYTQNVPQYVVALIAAWKLGAIAVAINPMLTPREIEKLIGDSTPSVFLALSELYSEELADTLARSSVTRVITTSALDFQCANDSRVLPGERIPTPSGTEDLRELVDRFDGQAPDGVALDADDVAVITYTSGTTGAPKGAMNTHRNVATGGAAYRDWFVLEADDVILGVAPLFHVTGLSGHIAAAIAAGASLVLSYRFDVGVTLDMIRTYAPTFTVGAITVFIALANSPDATPAALSSLTTIASGGAPIPAATVDRFESRFGVYVHNVYGMTETTSPVLSVPMGSRAPVGAETEALSVGVPVLSAQVRVVDESGTTLPAGQLGELAVRGPQVIGGYWRNEVETAAAIRDGWLLTGDVAYVDDDGWYYLVDRKKDMIVASGYKVWPREVEDVLYTHDAVLEAGVVGVPDPYRGETVKAYVSLREGVSVQPQELVDFCRARMAAYKYPREVEIVDVIPKTATGKILRRSLRAQTALVRDS
ncbi:AMP-binding protein [Mycolicibacterium sp.]|uniref:AMP-binding protein n=1 Tax=Mycolicibacterium sp. TaxID=2320850 RepID=UPI001A2C8ED6|nr:AMP-binding protein [Mycolicibacterium sp.]MBJ7336413.1 AMP-binding protein [Mycolicibacterium sp.]